MKMTAKFIERYPISVTEYRELEGFSKKQKLGSLVSHIFQVLIAKLSGGNDPQIKLKYSPAGHEYWYVYDPTTGKAETFATEADVRVWVEQRYHQ